jgi:hypothetical protein
MVSTLATKQQATWQARLQIDLPQAHPDLRQGVLNWLEGTETIAPDMVTGVAGRAGEKQLECRYRILQQRYLGVAPVLGYQRLLNRLSCLITRYPQIRSRLARTPEEKQTVIQLIQAVLAELLSEDVYLQGQKQRIAQCTQEPELRESLFFASLEEYCLQKSEGQPRFIGRLIGLLRRQLAAT